LDRSPKSQQQTPWPLSRRAERLISELPQAQAVAELKDFYPHLLDRVAACWYDRRLLDQLYAELAFQGARARNDHLSFKAVSELGWLHSHAMSVVHRRRPDPWQEVVH
jgi:hypothetical protein